MELITKEQLMSIREDGLCATSARAYASELHWEWEHWCQVILGKELYQKSRKGLTEEWISGICLRIDSMKHEGEDVLKPTEKLIEELKDIVKKVSSNEPEYQYIWECIHTLRMWVNYR